MTAVKAVRGPADARAWDLAREAGPARESRWVAPAVPVRAAAKAPAQALDDVLGSEHAQGRADVRFEPRYRDAEQARFAPMQRRARAGKDMTPAGRKAIRRGAVYTALFLLIGCTAPYGKKGELSQFGYTDQLLAPGKYRVRIDGAQFDTEETMKAQWHRRASELCGEKGYVGAPISGRDSKTEIGYSPALGIYPDVKSYQYAEGIAECKM